MPAGVYEGVCFVQIANHHHHHFQEGCFSNRQHVRTLLDWIGLDAYDSSSWLSEIPWKLDDTHSQAFSAPWYPGICRLLDDFLEWCCSCHEVSWRCVYMDEWYSCTDAVGLNDGYCWHAWARRNTLGCCLMAHWGLHMLDEGRMNIGKWTCGWITSGCRAFQAS